MKKIAILAAVTLLAACSAQLTAHEPSNPRVINADEFHPFLITGIIYDTQRTVNTNLVVDTIPQKVDKPKKSKIVTPQVKPKVVLKIRTKVVANTSPKRFALSRIGRDNSPV
jgi:hypothetical protein